jgi:septum formation topological specificity factor MinE
MGKTVIRLSCVMTTTFVALAAAMIVVPARAQSVSSDVLTKARNNCLTSVAKVVGSPRSSLKVIQQTSNASGISVDVKVPKATAAWGCLTDRQGKVEDVHFKGSEGAL